MDPIKVFIIDDHSLFIEGLYSLLSDEDTLVLVGHSTSPADFLARMDEYDADVFLVDINMSEMSGVDLTRRMLARDRRAKILALTMYEDYQYIEKMLQSGALGYSLKSDNLNELVVAVKTVARGRRYVSESIKEMVTAKIGTIQNIEINRDISSSKLTKRETEVLLLVAKEHSNKQIAEKLFISEWTVETHRKNIFAKTNTNSAIGMLKYAIMEGLIKI